MNRVLVDCDRLSVVLDGSRVLDNLTLQVCEGDFLGIVGPNGGGKTTLLRVILGLQKPSDGTVTVFDKEPGQSPSRTGYVPQHLVFDRDFPISVRDMVLMGRLSGKKPLQQYTKSDRERVDEALETVGMSALKSRRIGVLSGGELQRTLIARALAGDPELLLLDEPTASVDPVMKTSIYDLLDRLKKQLTIVLVTHDTGTISRHVSRVVCLNCSMVLRENPLATLSGRDIQKSYPYDVDLLLHHQESSRSLPEKS
ncbi:metal ABC transporter ATP-binding protein [Chlorobium phaeobacteroides]|uniref:ABC transporter related protein n=1 Tax=Chlorobium phaeobacteroides (strain DSM 266 / SMG 266 / 2430) TaxID=290317 RepID=A1BJ86_CHLPD|nr:ABC transporter ATP-binding protein [Chlorobium phaeobacteroides]ABL66463.1 ABC transporter related protein [Chlorobium phaeobacteroides DSM 266]MBV5319509.1 ABC transporter ATP-binding protein [Chlorobium phaeobacteroides]